MKNVLLPSDFRLKLRLGEKWKVGVLIVLTCCKLRLIGYQSHSVGFQSRFASYFSSPHLWQQFWIV